MSFEVAEYNVDEDVGAVEVCFVLTNVPGGFIQDDIWVFVSTENHTALGECRKSEDTPKLAPQEYS